MKREEEFESVCVAAEILCSPAVADRIREELLEFVRELVTEIGEPDIVDYGVG